MSSHKQHKRLKVLIAASEVAPFAKTGGLADVTGSLPLALEGIGCDVRVIMPRYASVKTEADEAPIGKNGKIYFVRHDAYFKRPCLYGDQFGDYHDNLERFSFFCREALERCRAEGFKPDIIHCHDWQTALIPTYLNTIYKCDPFFAGVRTLFTIHNVAYQGIFGKDEFPKLGLDWSLFTINYFEFYDKVNLMKGGIIFGDAVSTVSQAYAREILDKEYGCGLEGVLKTRENVLTGILNGLDYELWDPATDGKIARNYSLATVEDKYVNKEALQTEVGFKIDRDIPLVGMVTRLADQKGLDLLGRIADEMLNMRVQFVLLGTGEHRYHVLFEKIGRAHPRNASVNLRFDAILAEKIYAGSDLFLVPSRYEPCGLAQLISFRYGTVPIVRLTGGLKDSVSEFDPATKEGTGFTFTEYRPEDFLAAVKRALAAYNNKAAWAELVRKVMALDFSWKTSAEEYKKLYEKILKDAATTEGRYGAA